MQTIVLDLTKALFVRHMPGFTGLQTSRVCVCVVCVQQRVPSVWRRCAPIRWFPGRTRLRYADAASWPVWDDSSNRGNGERKRATSSSRRLQVRDTHSIAAADALSSCLSSFVDDWQCWRGRCRRVRAEKSSSREAC